MIWGYHSLNQFQENYNRKPGFDFRPCLFLSKTQYICFRLKENRNFMDWIACDCGNKYLFPRKNVSITSQPPPITRYPSLFPSKEKILYT